MRGEGPATGGLTATMCIVLRDTWASGYLALLDYRFSGAVVS